MPLRKSKFKVQKSKLKNKQFKASLFQTIVVLSPVIVILVAILFAFLCFLVWQSWEHENDMPKTLTNKGYNTGRQYPIENWKIYTNKTYGFSLRYPSQGYIQDPECFKKGICNGKVHLAACGTDIKTGKIGNVENITIDNMLGIFIHKFDGSVTDFITQQGGGENNYKLEGISRNKNKQLITAIQVLGLKKGIVLNTPSPIAYPSYLVGNGKYMVNAVLVQNFGSKTGCLPPAGTKASSFNSFYWNIPENLTFN